jgi:hypothetical protein
MHLLDRAVVEAVIPDLSAEPDEQVALRKALLALIQLTQDEVSEDVSAFVDYLLYAFPPLSGSFVDDRQPFISDEEVTRDHLGPHARLLLRDDFMYRLVAQIEGQS